MMNIISQGPIEVDKYIPQKLPVYFKSKFAGLVNEEEFHQLRYQILLKKVTGYSIKYNGEHIMIYANGDVEKWPKGFFDETSRTVTKILKKRRDLLKD